MNIREFAKVMIERGLKETFNSDECKMYANDTSNVTLFRDTAGWYIKRVNNLGNLHNYIYIGLIPREFLIGCLNGTMNKKGLYR